MCGCVVVCVCGEWGDKRVDVCERMFVWVSKTFFHRLCLTVLNVWLCFVCVFDCLYRCLIELI